MSKSKMYCTKKRNFISAVIIMVMVSGVITLPVFNDNYSVNAAVKKVKVKFNVNGGTKVKQKIKNSKGKYTKKYMTSKKVTYKKKYGTLAKVKRTGYTFNGWYIKKTGGKKITAKSKVDKKKSHTLYARWKANEYNVFFQSDGGTVLSPIRVTYDKPYGKLPVPVKDNFNFEGWYTAQKDGTKVTETTIYKTAENSRLYARWSPVV